MIKLVAFYSRPADEAAFIDHYANVHTPLVHQIPGLQKLVVNRAIESPLGEPPYWMIAEMHFSDRAAFDAALASPENRAAGRDIRNFAIGLVTLAVVEGD